MTKTILQEGSLYRMFAYNETDFKDILFDNNNSEDYGNYYYMGKIKNDPDIKVFISQNNDPETHEIYLVFDKSHIKKKGNKIMIKDSNSELLFLLIHVE